MIAPSPKCPRSVASERIPRTLKGLVETFLKFWDSNGPEYIDPRIRPLCFAMNATGMIRTVASCQGHGVPGSSPYVYFKCSVKLASLIERVLREGGISGQSKLENTWTVTGHFDLDYEITFLLYSPALERRAASPIRSLWYSSLNRKALDKQLSLLVDVIHEAVFLDIWNDPVPQVCQNGRG